jgi:putative ABC transport system permease protein
VDFGEQMMSVPITRRSLLHEKGKLVLHIAGIAAALMLIMLLLGFRDGMYSSLTAYIDHTGADLIVSQIGSRGLFDASSALPADLHNTIGSVSGASAIDHILVGDTIFMHGGAKTPVLIIGYNLATGFGGPWNIGAGRFLQTDHEILLDTWLAWRSGVQIGDTVNLLGHEFTVVGLTRETSSWMSPYVFVSLPAAGEALQALGDASFFLLRLPPHPDRAAVSQAIKAEVPNISVLTPHDIAAADRKFLAAVLDRPINVMLLISGVIAVAVMGLITYTGVMGRLREYSVLKAIGASNGWLLWVVVRETIYRMGFGFAAGIVLSYLFAALIMRLWPQFTVTISPQMIPLIGAASLVHDQSKGIE